MGEGKKVVSPPGVENVRLMGHRPNIPLTCLSAPGGCTKNRYFICVPKILLPQVLIPLSTTMFL